MRFQQIGEVFAVVLALALVCWAAPVDKKDVDLKTNDQISSPELQLKLLKTQTKAKEPKQEQAAPVKPTKNQETASKPKTKEADNAEVTIVQGQGDQMRGRMQDLLEQRQVPVNNKVLPPAGKPKQQLQLLDGSLYDQEALEAALSPRAVAEYLIVTGDFSGFDEAVDDLMATGLLTSQDAREYMEMVGLEYESLMSRLVGQEQQYLQDYEYPQPQAPLNVDPSYDIWSPVDMVNQRQTEIDPELLAYLEHEGQQGPSDSDRLNEDLNNIKVGAQLNEQQKLDEEAQLRKLTENKGNVGIGSLKDNSVPVPLKQAIKKKKVPTATLR